MNIKRNFIGIIVASMFLTACNINSKQITEPVADKATQQKTMTKVQNDVNEIMNKDYEYVIQNMGIPYCTTYYMDTDIDKELNVLEDIRNNTDCVLVYPKYSLKNELGDSALYIELHNNKVVEVQTHEFSKYDFRLEELDSSIDLIIDMYDENCLISLENIKNENFKKYIGLEIESLNEIVDIDLSNFEVYDKYRNNMVMGFFLGDKDVSDEILVVFESDSIIREIMIINESETIELIKSKLIE